jgi:menaquinone-dependent protoporphyrinogen oxidase
MNILLLHSSTDGHTVKIMEYIGGHLSGRAACEILDLNLQPEVNFAGFDRVIIGASIRYGKFNQNVYQFVSHYQTELEAADAAYFGVNLTARKPGKENPAGNPYIEKFLKASPWQPRRMALFAGALDYSKYGFVDRNMIRFIMKITGGPTDPSTQEVFTNWQAVEAFADNVAT